MNALARAGAVVREFTLPEAEAAYAVFLQGSLSAIELTGTVGLKVTRGRWPADGV